MNHEIVKAIKIVWDETITLTLEKRGFENRNELLWVTLRHSNSQLDLHAVNMPCNCGMVRSGSQQRERQEKVGTGRR